MLAATQNPEEPNFFIEHLLYFNGLNYTEFQQTQQENTFFHSSIITWQIFEQFQ